MRIKRTYGATMREALDQVKLEQGPDAVILGNKKVPGGVEILSAVDFDHSQVDAYSGNPGMALARGDEALDLNTQVARQQEARAVSSVASSAPVPDFLFDQTDQERREPVLGIQPETSKPVTPAVELQVVPKPDKSPRKPAQSSRQSAGTGKTRAKPARKAQSSSLPRNGRTLPVEEEALARSREADRLLGNLRERQYSGGASVGEDKQLVDQVRDELKHLRDLMEGQLNVLEWDRYSQRHPVRSVLLNLMAELGLGQDVCTALFNKLGKLDENPHKVWQRALGIIAAALPIARKDILAEGGRIALVGSTGVGKTTTIAKLAARFAQSHGKRSVALVSTDNFRIGAQEQLQHFARMLEVPLLTANGGDELADRLHMLADKQLVLIDTAGMSQTDVRLSEQFHKLRDGSPEIQPYLVLSANTQLAAINETIRNFSRAKLAGAIVTKLDESASLGGILTAAIRHKLPLAYCGTGQRVPEDLQQAKSHRLVSKAVSLMQNYTEQLDKETLAFRYNHIISKKQQG
jgi:flagellar biosynthesis protein FlhF